MKFREIGKELGAMWQSLPEPEKTEYKERGEKDKIRYQEEYKIWARDYPKEAADLIAAKKEKKEKNAEKKKNAKSGSSRSKRSSKKGKSRKSSRESRSRSRSVSRSRSRSRSNSRSSPPRRRHRSGDDSD